MRVLMLSRDTSGRDPNSQTAKRWDLLRRLGVDLRVVILSNKRFLHAYREAAAQAPQADLITAQDPFELGLISLLLARRFGVPLEIQDHGGFFDGDPADEPLWFIRRHLANWLIRRADLVRTVSSMSAENLEKMGCRVYHLPIAADARFAGLQRSPEADLIVSVGRLVSVKRHDLLLRAFAAIRLERARARLVLVGEGPERERLRRLAQALGIDEAVEFRGHDDPADVLSRASLFVLCSAHEGWGVAAVEAALAGVPVLMTRTGCAGWLESRHAAKTVPISANAEEIARTAILAMDSTASFMRLKDAQLPESTAKLQIDEWQKIEKNRVNR